MRGIVIKHLRERSARDAGVAELADAWDLKSHGSNPVPVRPRSPAPYRGVEQLVARRAHNPEAAGSSPVPATISSIHKGFDFMNTRFFILIRPYVLSRRDACSFVMPEVAR